jgi:hypothetical protein
LPLPFREDLNLCTIASERGATSQWRGKVHYACPSGNGRIGIELLHSRGDFQLEGLDSALDWTAL